MATIYYTASTLDGFIATEDHSLEWLLTRDVDPAGPMGYDAFGRSVGALLMGANTYQWLLDHEPEEWSFDVPTWVFTHHDLPGYDGADITLTSDPVPEVHARAAAAAGDRHVWVVGGGDLAGQLADAGLLDEVWVQFAPVTIGAGRPLLPRHVELALQDVARNRDFVCARYSLTGTPSSR